SVSDSRRRVANDLFNRLTHKNADRFQFSALRASTDCRAGTDTSSTNLYGLRAANIAAVNPMLVAW
ncbi:hypothetical protein, partial [Burkholderia ubonensis]|uniref:hypothetical protein n=1 Tax=Burkholderia ubonensis TaxID=101571 RepID=UPI000ABFC800